jgi:hypothetical protein
MYGFGGLMLGCYQTSSYWVKKLPIYNSDQEKWIEAAVMRAEAG